MAKTTKGRFGDKPRAHAKPKSYKRTVPGKIHPDKKAARAIVVKADDIFDTDVPASKRDYRPVYAEMAGLLVSVYGSTHVELGAVFGVDGFIIEEWMRRHPAFRDAVLDAANSVNYKVMQRLFRQCMGFRYEAEKVFYDGKRGKVVKTKYMEYSKPDTAAMVFFLKNRMPDKWVDSKAITDNRGAELAAEIEKMFNAEVAPDAAIDTYNKLLEIEAKAVEVQPDIVYYKPREKPAKVEKSSAVDTEDQNDENDLKTD